MYCVKCGNNVKAGEAFCRKCGTPVSSAKDNEKKDDNVQEKIVKKKSKLPLVLAVIALSVILVILIFVIIMMPGIKATKEYDTSIEVARQYLNDKDYDRAIAAYERAIEIDPKKKDAYIGLADLYLETGDTEKALEVLNSIDAELSVDDQRAINKKIKKIEESYTGSGNVSSDKEKAAGKETSDSDEKAHTQERTMKAMKAYNDILLKRKEDIVSLSSAQDDDYPELEHDLEYSYNVAVADITGDNVPELLFLGDISYGPMEGIIIYTVDDNGELVNYYDYDALLETDYYNEEYNEDLFSYTIDGPVSFILFQTDEPGVLYECQYDGIGNNTDIRVCRLHFYDSGKITREWDYCDEKSFIENEMQNMRKVLIYHDLIGLDVDDVEEGHIAVDSKYFANAEIEFTNIAGALYETGTYMADDDNILPFYGSITLDDKYSNDYGYDNSYDGWINNVTIDGDGKFSGNIGWNGYEYKVNVAYSGKFTDIKRINEYTYSMKVSDFSYDEQLVDIYTDLGYTEEQMIDEYSKMCPLKEGQTVYFYLPGMPYKYINKELNDLTRGGFWPIGLGEDSCGRNILSFDFWLTGDYPYYIFLDDYAKPKLIEWLEA